MLGEWGQQVEYMWEPNRMHCACVPTQKVPNLLASVLIHCVDIAQRVSGSNKTSTQIKLRSLVTVVWMPPKSKKMTAELEGAPATKRRQLSRRSTDDRVDRILQTSFRNEEPSKCSSCCPAVCSKNVPTLPLNFLRIFVLCCLGNGNHKKNTKIPALSQCHIAWQM